MRRIGCLARNVILGVRPPRLLRATRRPGVVISRPFPLHAITARNKAASFIFRMHKSRASSPTARKRLPSYPAIPHGWALCPRSRGHGPRSADVLKGRLGIDEARIPQKSRNGLVWVERCRVAIDNGSLVLAFDEEAVAGAALPAPERATASGRARPSPTTPFAISRRTAPASPGSAPTGPGSTRHRPFSTATRSLPANRPPGGPRPRPA